MEFFYIHETRTMRGKLFQKTTICEMESSKNWNNGRAHYLKYNYFQMRKKMSRGYLLRVEFKASESRITMNNNEFQKEREKESEEMAKKATSVR